MFRTFVFSKKHFANFDGVTSKTASKLFKDVKLRNFIGKYFSNQKKFYTFAGDLKSEI